MDRQRRRQQKLGITTSGATTIAIGYFIGIYSDNGDKSYEEHAGKDSDRDILLGIYNGKSNRGYEEEQCQ